MAENGKFMFCVNAIDRVKGLSKKDWNFAFYLDLNAILSSVSFTICLTLSTVLL